MMACIFQVKVATLGEKNLSSFASLFTHKNNAAIGKKKFF